MPRAARWLAVLSLALTGCAHAALQYGRDGLAPVDHAVRAGLVTGRYGTAYEAALGSAGRDRDRLLRALSVGALGLYASRTDSSVWALDRAWTLTEDRWSKRISAGAAAVVVNDYVLPYVPGKTERLFIPYYGALSWLARGDRDDAAVEARRLTQLLGEAPTDGAAGADGELRGVLHYVAGAVFEAAGERASAEVAYRNAARLVQVPVVRDSAVADSLMGDVVVVVEQGFVGHPVPRDETVWVSRHEYSGLRRNDRASRDPVARGVVVRESMRGVGPWYGRGVAMGVGLTLNWAEFRDGRAAVRALAVGTTGATQDISNAGNVSRAVRADFDQGQPARFARALTRAAARATLYDAAGDQLAKVGTDFKDDDRGRNPGRRRGANAVSDGRATNAPAANSSEAKEKSLAAVGRVLAGLSFFALAAASDVNDVPDLRSWNVLPHDVRVVRLQLAAGEHDVNAMVDGVPVTVRRVQVRPGTVTVINYRSFGADRR